VIAYVVKMFPRFSETFVLAEILELERRGRAIEIVSLRKPDDGCFHGELARLRARVRYLPEHVRCKPARFLAAHGRQAWRSPWAYARALGLALRYLPSSWAAFLRAPLVVEAARSGRATHLHAHFASLPAATALFASILSGLPFSFTAHAKDIYHRSRSRRLLRLLLRRARCAVTVSDANVRALEALRGEPREPGRIVRIYNGVDLAAFRPPVRRPREAAPLLVAVGRLVEKKGFDLLVEACAILRQKKIAFRCSIVGKGPLEPSLRAAIRTARLEEVVRLEGPLPRQEIAELLRRASILVVPSLVGRDGNREGLPTVIPEAMASGLPVVASSVTGIPEAVADGVTGLLVEPGDAPALARALETLLGDERLREEMGRAARARAERLFDVERQVSQLEEILFGQAPERVLCFPDRAGSEARAVRSGP